jgi:predicted  nucleic acid-binding Zn-ribbon protein
MGDIRENMERIIALEAEKKKLLLKIQRLEKKADAKTAKLENEILLLKEQVASLKVWFG